ncbi:HAD-IIB family hydrolase [Pseudomonas fluorescens]|uniref:HAD-IIB family hydrolase n=1 Tax=Pseudomonas fluorescens TaxID=294 RepID=UPI00277DDB59|nr:HAD-IIB family hydrolase [Pseudomonas fluorescens]MDP9785307.1 HAD superfamily hydrolase (TIGR01484 family) [Pseudomonas fluorescens]
MKILAHCRNRGIAPHMTSLGESKYSQEMDLLQDTYAGAMLEDVRDLQKAIVGASEASLIGVGSGGSFTVASLLCNLHEAYTGRVSRPSTPLEIICNPTLAASSPVFLVSAEGKNPDVIEALRRARRHSARPVHVIVNRADCPLVLEANALGDVKSHCYELANKDGYLATNSLLLDSILVARAYSELNPQLEQLPPTISELKIGDASIEEWVNDGKKFVEACVLRGTLTIVYSPLLKPIAADLESKLSEAALLHVQLVDLRSYAHGRHLWLANRPDDCAILAITDRALSGLWDAMKELFPVQVPVYTMRLQGASPNDLIAGLIAQMHLVGEIGKLLKIDPGKPGASDFGRKLYYLNLSDHIEKPHDHQHKAISSKYDTIGALWPSNRDHGPVNRAEKEFIQDLESKVFKCIVFDYDGTLCSSQRRDAPPDTAILNHLTRLVEAGVHVGIASGRGGSVQQCLESCLPAEILEKITIGLYNGGWISKADMSVIPSGQTSEFLSHVSRIIVRLKGLGIPIDSYKVNPPYQVSIRFREGLSTDKMWFVVADALRQDGLDTTGLVKSKHSVDVLAPGINKSRVIADIVQKTHIHPYEIITVGDQGAWPGNDFALLEHKYSLSVDVPSRRLDRGWKLAPTHLRDVDATLWYLKKIDLDLQGRFRFVAIRD